MEFPGKLSNALHLQQQTLWGGEWRSLPWAAKNGNSARAGNSDVSLKHLYPPQFNYKFATVPWKSHCGLCPAQAVGRGAWPWRHSLLPFAPLSITRGTKINVKLLFCTKLSLPRGKARLWGSVCLKMGHAGGCFPQPSSPQCSCTAGGEAILLLASGHDREKLQHRTNAPAPGSCQRPPRTWGCQDKCQNQSGLWGRFTQSTAWKLSTLIVPFFFQNICSACYST